MEHTVLRVGFRHAEVEGETIEEALANASDTTFGSEIDYEYHDPENYPPVEAESYNIGVIEGKHGKEVKLACMVVGVPKADHDSYYTIVAAGPLIKQDEMTAPSRPVLRLGSDGMFVVHDQIFDTINVTDDPSKYHFHNGGYCGNDVQAATACFAERITAQARHCEHLGEVTETPF